MLKGVRQTMFDLFQFVADCREAEVSDKSQKYLREVVARAVTETTLPLAEVVQAHRLLEERTVLGRLLLVP